MKAYKICWVLAIVMSQACHDAEKKSGKRDMEHIVTIDIPIDTRGGNASDKCCWADGTHYSFEIATGNSYRFFDYYNPEYAHGCPEAATILQFAAFMEKEFDFTYGK